MAVSGLCDPEMVAAAMAAGFDAHFTKPADPLKLVMLARAAATRIKLADE